MEKQKYEWKGKEYSVQGHIPSVDANGNALHGYLRLIQWKLDKVAENKLVASVDLTAEEYGPKGYPFSLSFNVEYEILADGVHVNTTVKNIGQDAAPFGIGYSK
jgi:aldose 1-epimerase